MTKRIAIGALILILALIALLNYEVLRPGCDLTVWRCVHG